MLLLLQLADDYADRGNDIKGCKAANLILSSTRRRAYEHESCGDAALLATFTAAAIAAIAGYIVDMFRGNERVQLWATYAGESLTGDSLGEFADAGSVFLPSGPRSYRPPADVLGLDVQQFVQLKSQLSDLDRITAEYVHRVATLAAIEHRSGCDNNDE